MEVVSLPALPVGVARHVSEAVLAAAALGRAGAIARKPRTAVSLARALAQHSPAMAEVRSEAARRGLARLSPVDGVIQVGSDFSLPAGTRYVTFEDMTIAQVRAPDVSHLYPPWDAISEPTAARLRRRQALLYAGAVACVATTHWTAASIASDYGIDKQRVVVAGVGAQARVRLSPRSWSPARFLFVGNDWKRKNGDAILRAFTEVRKKAPEATLDLVGGHPPVRLDGVTTHGVLHWSNRREGAMLARLFEAATCFVMPSLHEAAGMVYVEAGAAGVPSIGTTRGGASTLIGSGGRIVDPTDGAAIAQAMLDLTDGATAARLGQLASQNAQRFTWDLVAQRTLGALDLPGVDPAWLAKQL